MGIPVKVSLIIPVYNGAEFLRRIFDCAIYQTLPEVEVIAINDCSPNMRDAEIMHEYEERYPDKFRALFHNVNMRQGGARNTGIQSSNGEYFLCIDQDDYIDLSMCEKMYKKAKDDEAEIVICNFSHLSGGKKFIITPNIDIESADINSRMNIINYNYIWCMLVEKNFIVQNALYFPVNNTADDIIAAFWYYAANRISRLDDVMYFHTDNLYQTRKVQTDHFREHPIACARLLEYPYYKNLSNKKRCKLDEVLAHILLLCFVEKIVIDKLKIYSVKSKIGIWNEFKEVLKKLQLSQILLMAIEYIDGEIKNFDPADIICKWDRLIFDINMNYWKSIKKFDKRIVIWGAGIRGKRLAEYFSDCNKSFEITDSAPALYGKNVCGKKVKRWKELEDSVDIVIVSPLNAINEVKMKICNQNIEIIDYIDLIHKFVF